MKNLLVDRWVKAIDRTPVTQGSYQIKVGNNYPAYKFFDCSDLHKKDWIKLDAEWLEVKQWPKANYNLLP